MIRDDVEEDTKNKRGVPMKDIMAIVPSLNPDDALVEVVSSLISSGISNVIVVDDGSDEEHQKPFQIAKEAGCIVLKHEVNKGKGKALRTAFSYVVTNRTDIKAVITVDGDNQHTMHDIKSCIEKYRECPEYIVLGCRDFSAPDVPPRSKFGNNLTRAVFRFACGLNISDTQTGLRCIPTQYLQGMLEIAGDRYEYETNMLLYMKEKAIPFCEVCIHTIYIDENSSSHFSPIRDSIRIYKVIFKFLMSSAWAAVVDLVLFAVLCHFLKGHFEKSVYILISTIGARLVSSLCNFLINHKVVFKSDGQLRSSVGRYYILCVVQMMVSYSLVYLSSALFRIGGGLLVAWKAVIDVILFFISFRIQKLWVFKNERKN